ncbi:hypothetical protein BX666DRAFT_1977708 [Dichotomocladium elegans]|nr:hypothetical protein BX666DRAFT_1977708 [Dichotomocladium elegans]
MRIEENKKNERGKSINLALSERGLSALRNTGLDLEQTILEAAVPMKARMVHIGNKQISQAYSVHNHHINAVDRALLNDLLLDAAEKMPNVHLHFEHRLSMINFDKNELIFDGQSPQHADLIVGADGAYSKTRNQIMRKMRMDYEQVYIDTAYCELSMPPRQGENGSPEFALDPNHLHIWPRHTFMLIALPNPNRTFTCTLFMPFAMFEQIDTEDKLMDFFKLHFADAIPLIGEDRLKSDYFANPRGSLISIKTSPHHYDNKAVIIGDAAHAMVPFYGQGMNCGFQDVEVLHKILDQYDVTATNLSHLGDALKAYSATRIKDAHAICDLAMYNHYEMRSAVTSVRYLIRKKIEGWIHYCFPKRVIPLYTMVSFSTIPYADAVARWHRQTFWLNSIMGATSVAAVATAVALGLRSQKDAIMDVLKRSLSS